MKKGNRGKHTPESLIETAQRYAHRSDWKRLDKGSWLAAIADPVTYQKATAHMTYKASPYSGDYAIYAYEFSDRSVYVGLTFKKEERRSQHLQQGPVFEHSKICPNRELRYLEEGLPDPTASATAEIKWIEKYRSEGWTLLNNARGGSLGTFSIKWSKQDVLNDARKYQTRKAWYLGNQYLYSLAKKQGWFQEAVAHMPRKAPSPVRQATSETRERQSAAKKLMTPEQEAEILSLFANMGPWSRLDLRRYLSEVAGREVSLSFLHAFMRRHGLKPTLECRGRAPAIKTVL